MVAAIAQGKLRQGEALPSVRQLAADIGVNMHTVNKAYALLKVDGYLVIDRRSGARVAERLEPDGGVISRVRDGLRGAALEAYSRGMTREEFLALSAEAFDGQQGEANV